MTSFELSIKSWRSSVVEQLICNQQVGGSNPFASSFNTMHDAGYKMQDTRCRIHDKKHHSNHGSYIMNRASWFGEVAEWTKAADCKSAGASLRRFESCPPHFSRYMIQDTGCKIRTPMLIIDHASCIMHRASFEMYAGVAQLARASAFQAEGRGFESRLPLKNLRAHVAQSVEHILGKDEVSGSSPLVGSTTFHEK